MEPARLERYKANGWFNLGVRALQANRCATALDHFDEALLNHPADAVVVGAMGLADSCLDTGTPGAGARNLEFRLLED